MSLGINPYELCSISLIKMPAARFIPGNIWKISCRSWEYIQIARAQSWPFLAASGLEGKLRHGARATGRAALRIKESSERPRILPPKIRDIVLTFVQLPHLLRQNSSYVLRPY
jgi:hypothetical protein